jgi:hypothetical protein
MAMSIGRRRFVALAAAGVGVSALVGCGDDASAPAAPRSTRYGDDAWRTIFSPIGTGQSEEFLHYPALSAAVRDSKNLVVRVEAGRNVRIADDLGGETSAERWLVLAADLPVVRVLAGRGTAAAGTLEVQFASFDAPGPGDAEAVVAALSRALVELGPAIWILQRSSTPRPVHLRLATSQCLFVERRGKVTNPMYPGGKASDPVADEAMSHRTLDRLAAAIEAIAAA